MAAACPTIAPNCPLHVRLAFFWRRGSPPNGSSCSLAQRNWRRCCAKMAADTTHVTTHFYSIAWTTMAANIDLAIAGTYTACDPRFVRKIVYPNERPAVANCCGADYNVSGTNYGPPQLKQCPSLTGSSIAASPSSNPGSSSPTPGSSSSGCPGSESSRDSSVSPLPNSAIVLFQQYQRVSLSIYAAGPCSHTRG